MKYAIEMGTYAMTYIQNFIKIGSSIQKLMGIDTQKAWISHKLAFILLKKGK
jgi:hypothetical protein